MFLADIVHSDKPRENSIALEHWNMIRISDVLAPSMFIIKETGNPNVCESQRGPTVTDVFHTADH